MKEAVHLCSLLFYTCMYSWNHPLMNNPIVLLYIGIAKIRGFEGAAYSLWSLFMMAFTLAAVFIAKSDYRRI